MEISRSFTYLMKLVFFKRKWRSVNKDNFTSAYNVFPAEKVTVGRYSYGPLTVLSYGSANEKLTIGSLVSIANDVVFVLGGNHRHNTFSTYPFKVNVLGEKVESYSKGPIIVEDDVWIGMGATILSGVRLGRGAIIATRSVVARDVPPYAVVAGNPAQVVKYRFDRDMIEKLKRFDFSRIDEKFIKEHIQALYAELNQDTMKELTGIGR
ncbi:MAG: CatB-related O-acetyltransferase [Candidatus Omnitrophica bacterium]|nr:CatB-related O-acetyltransferase [Candidatus Omnitrophota bacterium]